MSGPRIPEHESRITVSFTLKRYHRINVCRATCRQPARKEGDEDKEQGNNNESERIGRANTEEQAAQKSR